MRPRGTKSQTKINVAHPAARSVETFERTADFYSSYIVASTTTTQVHKTMNYFNLQIWRLISNQVSLIKSDL